MKLSENTVKWLMCLYPPLFFNRIWVKNFGKDFLTAEVKISKSFLNRNYNGTIFGGTIFSAADPFYSIMFWQIFARKNVKIIGWLKSANIQYKKPGETSLTLKFSLTEEDVAEAEHALNTIGKFVKAYPVEAVNKNGDVCVIVSTEVYMRKLTSGQKQAGTNF